MEAVFSAAVDMIRSGEATCVVSRGSEILYTASGRGVKPLMWLVDNAPELLRGALVSDKIIGKAAAMLLIAGGAGAVYGEAMSAAAVETLSRHGVPHAYGTLVPVIRDRTGGGVCPIEASVLGEDEPANAVRNIRAVIAVLMAG